MERHSNFQQSPDHCPAPDVSAHVSVLSVTRVHLAGGRVALLAVVVGAGVGGVVASPAARGARVGGVAIFSRVLEFRI